MLERHAVRSPLFQSRKNRGVGPTWVRLLPLAPCKMHVGDFARVESEQSIVGIKTSGDEPRCPPKQDVLWSNFSDQLRLPSRAVILLFVRVPTRAPNGLPWFQPDYLARYVAIQLSMSQCPMQTFAA